MRGTPRLTRKRSRRASDMRLRVLTRDAVLRADGSAGVLLLPIIVPAALDVGCVVCAQGSGPYECVQC